MRTPDNASALDERLHAQPAIFILFGGAHCGVCQVIKPQIERMLAERFPDITPMYVDCEQQPDICGQSGVFSLPTVKLYLDGQLSLEMSRVFSLHALARDIERLHRLWKA